MLLNNKIFSNFFKYKRKLNNYVLNIVTQRRTATTQPGYSRDPEANQLKILFFGTDKFSIPSLKALHKNLNRSQNTKSVPTLGAVTSFKNPANCVRIYAEQQQLPLYRWPLTADDCQQYDLGVVVSFGHMIPEQIIKAFPLGMINVHASLLPRWRGAAPIIYAIMHGDATTGVSIMRIEPKHFDIGDILAQKEIAIKPNVLMPELHTELANEGAELLVNVVNDFNQKLKNAKKQDGKYATYAPKITPAVYEVNWSAMSAQQLYNRHRALFGFKQLHTQFDGKNVQLLDIKLHVKLSTTKVSLLHPGSFTYLREKKCLLVCCAEKTLLEVHKLRVEGRKLMNSSDFNNGFVKKIDQHTKLLFSDIKNIVC